MVVVTLGADGALVADGDGVVHAGVPAIREVNPTGSGDLLLAGLAVGIEAGAHARDAIRLGAACGTAGATQLKPELPPDFDPLEWEPAHHHHGGGATPVITLGIDIGTTHTKVLALDVESGRTLALQAVPTPVHRSAER